MKTILYFESAKALSKSGIGRALTHQKRAMESVGIDYSIDIDDYQDADIIHINTVYPKSYHTLKKMKKAGKVVVVHGHSTYEDFKNSFRCWKIMEPFMDRFITKMYTNADYIITPTLYSKNLIENYKGVNCKVVNISNGIDPAEYAYDEKKIDLFKEHFGFNDTDKVVIGIGWFFQRKGIQDFFEIARSMPDVKFIWFGHLGKLLTQGKILKSIKKKPENVIMPGYIKGDIIKGAMHFAKALLFPSYEETEGIVVLEALASGLPVVVRDIGVYADWLKDGYDCRKATDNEGFKRALEEIISGQGELLAKNGYNRVLERTIAKVGAQIEEAYKDAIKIKEESK